MSGMEPSVRVASGAFGGPCRRAAVSEAQRVSIVASHYRLRVNPIACDAFGYCAELVPEIIMRYEWGYPILNEAPIPPHLFPWAERAVRECPRRALFIEKVVAPRP